MIESFSNAEGIAAAVEDVADMYQMAGSHAKSYPLHRYVVEHWPEHERAIWCQMKAIMSQLRLGDLAKAEQDLGSLLSGFAGHKDLGPAVHEVVEEYRNTGAHAEGRELFAYLLENWDETPDTMLELQVGIALQSIKLRELDKADAAIEQLIADYNDHPKIAKALFQIAEQHYYANNYQQVVELLESIVSSYADRDFPAKSELPYLLATCYGHLGQYDKAIEYYKRTMEEYPKSRYAPRAPYKIGWICTHITKDYNDALHWFGQQRRLYADAACSEAALSHMGTIYIHSLNDYGKGAEVFEQYIQEYHNGVDYWGSLSNLALCYEKLGYEQKAAVVLEEAYDKAPTEGLRTSIIERITRLEEGGAE